MKRIRQESPQKVKVESIIEWRKCNFCGSCHADDLSKCPRIKSFDGNFNTHKNKGNTQ